MNVKKIEPDHERHGNYRQYYEYRNRDSRPQHVEKCLPQCLKKLSVGPPSEAIHMLDIGCNSGKLTHLLRELILAHADPPGKTVQCLGVDIDIELVDEARASYGSEHLEFAQADIGAIVAGRSGDRIQEHMTAKGIRRFDFVSCFSVLMFIHLNHGDDGLRKVLDYVCSRARILILEPQNWERYCEQVQRVQQTGNVEFDNLDSLEWRGSNGALERSISDYVISKGFSELCTVGQRNELNREILIFASNEK